MDCFLYDNGLRHERVNRDTSPTSAVSSRPEVFLRKVVLKICSKFTGEHPCRSTISIKLLCNFTEIALQHSCSLVNFLHIFRAPFLKRYLLKISCQPMDSNFQRYLNVSDMNHNHKEELMIKIKYDSI